VLLYPLKRGATKARTPKKEGEDKEPSPAVTWEQRERKRGFFGKGENRKRSKARVNKKNAIQQLPYNKYRRKICKSCNGWGTK